MADSPVADASPSNCSEASSAATEEEDFEERRRSPLLLSLGALALLAALCAVAALRFSLHSDGPDLRGDEPIAGISLRPSRRALPALPAMPAALPSLEPEDSPLPAAAAAQSSAVISNGPPSQSRYSKPSVVFGMLIKNLDYDRLEHASNFYRVFNATVKQAVASEAGIGIEPEDVGLSISSSSGSVVVECAVAVADSEVASDVQVRIGSSSRLAEALGLNLRALGRVAAWRAISVGQVEVASISDPVVLGTQEPTTRTTTKAPPTTTTAPAPPTTTERTCKGKGQMCFIHSQCCSGRCGGLHKCLPGMSQFSLQV